MPNLHSYRETTMLILQLAKAAICKPGGQFVGVQRGVPRTGNPNLVLFNDPMTGTTLPLAVNNKHFTVQRVQAKIEHSRHRLAESRRGGY
ncbi:MAG TPA: hypothetical protein VKX41_16925 [Alloacidobacterium sp.]|nr:hypothetical protein [Alloacidobacterium sp.]